MTTSDTIYMVKELAICQYVLIIHSPHLCSLPGFKAVNVEVGAAGIRCREVVSDDEWETWKRGDSETLRLPLARPAVEPVPASTDTAVVVQDDVLQGVLQRALEAIGGKVEKGEKEDVVFLSWAEGEDGTVLLDADLLTPGDEDGKEKLGGKDREMIMRIVQEYLVKKDREENKEKRQRDEL